MVGTVAGMSNGVVVGLGDGCGEEDELEDVAVASCGPGALPVGGEPWDLESGGPTAVAWEESEAFVSGWPFGIEFESEPFAVDDAEARESEPWRVVLPVSSVAPSFSGDGWTSLSLLPFLLFFDCCWPIWLLPGGCGD